MSDRTDEAHEAAAPAGPPTRWRQPRWLTVLVVLVLAFAGVATIVTAVRTLQDDDPRLVFRSDAVANLLGWLPASDANRRSFAVWAGESAVDATPPPVLDVGLQDDLGIEPVPPTLGRSGEWRASFGWGAGDVVAWAVAGPPGAETAILAGRFDLPTVRETLEEAGYELSAYQGGSVYVLHPVATPSPTVDGDRVAAANAVGILAGRIITAPRGEDVRAAIDAATGQTPALADDPGVVALLDAVRPSIGLAAIDAADLAAICATGDPLARAPDASPSGRYAALAYGLASGARQSVVAVTFPDAATAEANAAAWSAGWVDAVVSLGDVASPASAYGEVTSAAPLGPALIARVASGRVDGWAPLALRIASPVCVAVADLTPPPTPPPATPLPTPTERLADTVALLPDAGAGGTLLFADLAATGQARGLAAPTAAAGVAPPVDEVAAWWSNLGPLPEWALLPADPGALAQIPVVFGLGLDQIEVVAEARSASPSEMVGVLTGGWNPAVVQQTLANNGYEWLPAGEAIVFAVPLNTALPPWAPAAWANVAIWGDHLFLSPSGRTLRQALDAAVSGTATTPPDSPRATALAAVPEATAGLIVGADAARVGCAARGVTGQTPGWDGLAAFWLAAPEGDRAALVVEPAAGVPAAEASQDLANQIARARIVAPADAATPGTGRALDRALGYAGTRTVAGAGGATLVVADFAVPSQTPEAGGFFTVVNVGCAFVARP